MTTFEPLEGAATESASIAVTARDRDLAAADDSSRGTAHDGSPFTAADSTQLSAHDGSHNSARAQPSVHGSRVLSPDLASLPAHHDSLTASADGEQLTAHNGALTAAAKSAQLTMHDGSLTASADNAQLTMHDGSLTAAADSALSTARTGCTVTAGDGTRLYVRDVGSGAPVVFLHSWMLASPMWQYQVAELARRGHRCILPDRRGHGRSDEPGSGYDLDTLVDEVDRIADAFGLEQFALVGHSFGCVEAVRYAATQGRGRITRAALLSPTTPMLRRTDDNPLGIDDAAFEFLRESWRRDFAAWIDENTAAFVTPETSPGIARWISDMMLRTPLDVGIACNETMVAADTRDDLRSLTIPALVVHGDADASAPLALTGLPTAELLPNAELRVYEGAPHGLFVTHRERLNADLARFLAG